MNQNAEVCGKDGKQGKPARIKQIFRNLGEKFWKKVLPKGPRAVIVPVKEEKILNLLYEEAKELNLGEIHEKAGLDRSSIVKAVGNLTICGLISRDGEKRTYKITDYGKHILNILQQRTD